MKKLPFLILLILPGITINAIPQAYQEMAIRTACKAGSFVAGFLGIAIPYAAKTIYPLRLRLEPMLALLSTSGLICISLSRAASRAAASADLSHNVQHAQDQQGSVRYWTAAMQPADTWPRMNNRVNNVRNHHKFQTAMEDRSDTTHMIHHVLYWAGFISSAVTILLLQKQRLNAIAARYGNPVGRW